MFSLKLFQTHFKISPIYSSSFYFTITKPKSPLFVRLGGESSLLRVLDIFDTKIRNDSVLKSYFTNSSLSKIHEHQKKTLTIAFGDPSGYTSRDIKSFHSSMHIKESDWRIYLEHLKESLSQLSNFLFIKRIFIYFYRSSKRCYS